MDQMNEILHFFLSEIFSFTLVIDLISDLLITILPIDLVNINISLPSSEIISPMYSPPSFLVTKKDFQKILVPATHRELNKANNI